MADYVLNEWVWADAVGENGRTRQLEAFQVLSALSERSDRIVVVKGSSFYAKAWKLCIAMTLPAREIAQFFKLNFLFNSDKCRLLNESELEQFPLSLSDVKNDDQYLVRAQLTATGSVIITTDRPLKAALDQAGIPCEHRDDFVARYLAPGAR